MFVKFWSLAADSASVDSSVLLRNTALAARVKNYRLLFPYVCGEQVNDTGKLNAAAIKIAVTTNSVDAVFFSDRINTGNTHKNSCCVNYFFFHDG